MLFLKILRDFNQRKLRTILTIFGLAIGVFSITGFMITSDSILESAEYDYGINSADFEILFDYETVSIWKDDYLTNVPIVKDYEPSFRYSASFEINSEIHNSELRGIEIERIASLTSLAGIFLVEGELPEEGKNEILLDFSAAKEFDVQLNSTIEFKYLNEEEIVNTIDLKVVGYARNVYSPSYTFETILQIWISIDQIQTLLGKEDVVTSVFVKLIDVDNIPVESEKVKKALVNEGIDVFATNYYNLETDWRTWLLGLIGAIITLMGVFSLITGGILSANTIQMAVAAEKGDIALLKVIGGRKKHILSIYLLEAVIFGIFGAILGIVISLGVSRLLIRMILAPFNVSTFIFKVTPLSIALGIVIPVATSVIFALPTILRTLKITSMEAFRDAPLKIKRNKTKAMEKIVIWKYSFRNLFRNKKRSIMNILMLSLAIALVVSITAARNSYLKGVDEMYDNQPTDISLYLPETNLTEVQYVVDGYTSTHYTDEFKAIHYIRWYWAGYNDTSWGIHMYVPLLGIYPSDSILESYRLVEGRLLTSADANTSNIVVTRLFIEKHSGMNHGLHKTIELESNKQFRNFTIVGIIEDLQQNGHIMYIPMSTMNDFCGDSNIVNTVYLELKDNSLEEEITSDLKKYEEIVARAWHVDGIGKIKDIFKDQMNFVLNIFTIVIVFGIIISFLGGMNSFIMSASERQKEISLLKLIGSKPTWITSSFLIEGVFIGVIASIIGSFIFGIVLGMLIVKIVSDIYLLCSFILSPFDILIGIAIGLIVGTLSTLYPGIRASKTNVVSALLYE
ncbi:MAG: FtsX-like permease family protein [Asgard group archaeon]|nr:FtsX-like permease family protein [Asgard group archaeon]